MELKVDVDEPQQDSYEQHRYRRIFTTSTKFLTKIDLLTYNDGLATRSQLLHDFTILCNYLASTLTIFQVDPLRSALTSLLTAMTALDYNEQTSAIENFSATDNFARIAFISPYSTFESKGWATRIRIISLLHLNNFFGDNADVKKNYDTVQAIFTELLQAKESRSAIRMQYELPKTFNPKALGDPAITRKALMELFRIRHIIEDKISLRCDLITADNKPLDTSLKPIILQKHTYWIQSVVIVDGRIHVGSTDCTITVWDMETLQLLATLQCADRVNTVCCTNTTLFAGLADHSIQVYSIHFNVETQEYQYHTEKKLKSHKFSISNLAVYVPKYRAGMTPKDTKKLLFSCAGSWDGIVVVWDADSLLKVGEIMVLSEDGSVSGVVTRDGDIGKTKNESNRINLSMINVFCSVKGNLYVSYTEDSKLARSFLAKYSIHHSQCHFERKMEVGDHGVKCYAEFESHLFTAGTDSTVKLWKLDSLELFYSFSPHVGIVNSIAIGHGKLVTAATDKTLKVFDVQNLSELRTLVGHADWVESVAVASGVIVSGSRDKTLHIRPI